jgi:protein-S-isoprenylcysteine O-methyltransferase Ste14
MITSALPLVFVVVAIGVLAVTGNLFTSSPFVIAAQVAAVGLNVWARRSFQEGTFRVSALTLTIGVAVTAVVVARVIAEERLLSAQYPEYRDYARSTKALVPFLF